MYFKANANTFVAKAYSVEKQEKSDKTLVNLRIDKDLVNRGKALAKRKGGNLSTLLRGLLIAALEEDEAREVAKSNKPAV